VGPDKDSTSPAAGREPGRRKHPPRRPRTRSCLLKGCERRFCPRQARQRYCSEACRGAAQRWSRWKAQQSYRATAKGKEKRNGQSRRYRQRVRKRQQPEPQEAARVITKDFFRSLLRPARLLRRIRAPAAIAAAALLFKRVPARCGTRLATRTALAPGFTRAVEDVSQGTAEDNPGILIHWHS
jgi:hypothetical protein